MANLEGKCVHLESTVDHLHAKLERSAEVAEKPHIAFATTATPNHDVQHLEKQLRSVRAEKISLEQRLETWRAKAEDLRDAKERGEDRINQLESELQRSETRANAARVELDNNRAHLESTSQDNFLREELARLRRENDNLSQRLKEATRKITILESDKTELETKIEKRIMTSTSSKEHVRSQIPLTSSHQQHHHMLKIKLAEQETERQRRKVRALEDQLAELERAHGSRIQELLAERRKEKDRQSLRQREATMRSEEALAAKERIYKERIRGLEEQIETLRDQLSKELKRRQILISGKVFFFDI